MPLKLTSNVGRLDLTNVGSFNLALGKINILIKPGCKANVVRGGKTVLLGEATTTDVKVSGTPMVDDIYTIERGLEKIVVTVDEERQSAGDNLSIGTDTFSESNNQGRRTTFTVGIILLVLLVVSVVFGIKQKGAKDFEAKSEIKLNEAVTSYESAVAGALEPKEAKDLFLSSKTVAFELKDAGYKNEKLNELIKNINEKEADLIGEVRPEVKEFLDLTLQTSGFNGNEMVSSGEEVFIFDSSNKNIIKVGIKNKSAKIAADKEDIGETSSIGSYEDRLFINRDDGIYEVETNASRVIEKDWDKVFFYLYAGNIYLVDVTNNAISRYSGIQGGFVAKNDWLAPGIETDFSKIVDMTIDGSIWLLSSSGKVTKFTNGNPVSISLNGIIEPLENPTAIYTNENNKNVYILEKDKGRIVAIDKTGEFKLQYTSDEIKNTNDLVVSETEGKIILLSGSKLLYFEPR